jgi:phosphoribosylaminoimidazole (AIR) synthetase
MREVFNMGTGFCCVVCRAEADAALELLRTHYPHARRIGQVTDEPGVVRLQD